VRAFSKAHNLSIEMAGRKLRHDFLARSAVERKIPSIALAHHLDDQLELFFLRLLRGSGGEGLAGMKWSSVSPSNSAVTLVRPLLDCSKDALRKFGVERRINFREDASNARLDIQRNRIRHELLPLLQREYQPGLARTLPRIMEIVGAESDFVRAAAEAWLLRAKSAHTKVSEDRPEKPMRPDLQAPYSYLALTPFPDLPVALQRRCLQLQLLRLSIVPDYDLIEHLRLQPDMPAEISADKCGDRDDEVVETPGIGSQSRTPYVGSYDQQTFRAGAGLRLLRDHTGIVRLIPLKNTSFGRGSRQVDLRASQGQLHWHGVSFAWEIQDRTGAKLPEKTPETEIFDADEIGVKVVIRHWRPGDRFQPIGMAQTAKLQDLFVNHKVPREVRRELMIAASARGDIFWVEGLRISERFKLTKSTIRRLHWAWQRL
jgi:tRNA(Ile)-lysidine synthase